MEGNEDSIKRANKEEDSASKALNVEKNAAPNISLQSFSSSFVNKPIAASSPINYPDFDILKLKALMPQELDRTSMPRRDVFLKPLPGVSYYGRPFISSRNQSWGYPGSYEPCLHPNDHCFYSMLFRSRSEPSSIGQSTMKQTLESCSSGSEKDEVTGILKKSIDFADDKLSSSSSVKDIKVFQSGGVLILQNIKDSSEDAGKKALSEISSKLIEDCHKLSEELKDEPKESRVVQFDLTPSAESPSDSLKIGREQPSSLSTNESLPWQSVGMSSPSSSTCARRLEWDSGADVGYSDKDLTKEKISTLERQALQGFNPLPKAINTRRGDNVLRRIPSDVIEVDERHSTVSVKDAATDPHIVPEHPILSRRSTSDSNQYTTEETETTLKPDSDNSFQHKKTDNSNISKPEKSKKIRKDAEVKSPKHKIKSKERKTKNSSSESGADASSAVVTKEKVNMPDTQPQPIMKDHSASVNTLGEEFGFYKLASSGSGSSERLNKQKSSPRTKKLKKKKPPEMSVRSRKIQEIIEIAKSFSRSDETECKLDEIIVDHSFHDQQTNNVRPISASSSNKTVVAKQVEEKTVQTSFREVESKGVQAEPKFRRTTSKNIQASGELNSLPKHLDVHQFFEMSGAVRTKSTQFFGDGVNSLPRGLNHGDRIRKVDESKKKLGKIFTKNENKTEASGLTVEVLRERREVADPSIIQEKFFESQRKAMVSKSTSMENTSISKNSKSASKSIERDKVKKREMVCASTSIDKSRIVHSENMISASTSIDKSRITHIAEMVCASTSIDKSEIGDGTNMVSASTSMERQSGSTHVEPRNMVAASTSTDQLCHEEETKDASRKMVSVGVQYSPKNDSKKSEQPNDSRLLDTRMSGGVVRDAWTDTLDSQASSTQTAHSWVHGGGPPQRESVVRTTRSFEYLPGEVYESSGNLREKLPSDASHNVITESSSSADSDDEHPAPSECDSIQGVGVPSLALSGNTVVIDDSCPATPAAWVMIAGGSSGVQIIKKSIDTFQNNQTCSSDGSGKSNSDESRNIPDQTVDRPCHKPGKSKDNHKNGREGNDRVEVRRCSAAVQTETPETSSQRRDSEVIRLFRRIENFLIAQSDRNDHQIQSLDRGSSKMASASHKTSISLQSSPKRNFHTSQNPRLISNCDEFDTVVENNSNIGARASSTPKLPSLSDNQCMKMSSENVSASNSARNTASSSHSRQPHSGVEEYSTNSKSEKSCPSVHQKSTKNVCIDSETQVGMTLQKCFCSHCTCRGSAPTHVDQATQMSLRNYKTQSSPKDSTVCLQCKKRPCVCQIEPSTRSFTDDGCLRCKLMPCKCLAINSDRSSKIPNENSNRNGKCLDCELSTCICRKPNQSTSSSDKQLKMINGLVFSTYVDEDFSSSEALPSSTSTSDKRPTMNGVKKKTKSDSCSVCRCASTGDQSCVFCVCHIDKNAHIPRCDCHEKIPRFLIPGFCKCHRRNLRYFDKCRCCVQTEMVDNICPCCEYFAVRMRAKLLESQLQHKTQLPSKREESQEPKNYFLQLEETEISKDSSEISEQEKQPLEVVTIKIPVKRMGAKVSCQQQPQHQFYYGGQLKQSEMSDSRRTNRVDKDLEYLDDIVKRYLLSSRRTETNEEEENLSSKRKERMKRSSRESGKSSTSYRTLQECLESNRPDFLSSAEYRREVIRKKASEREHRKQNHIFSNRPIMSSEVEAPKRIFTTSEIRAQTRKKCKHLSEVTQKKEDRKKRESYQTNKIMAEIFAKRLQLKTLRGTPQHERTHLHHQHHQQSSPQPFFYADLH